MNILTRLTILGALAGAFGSAQPLPKAETIVDRYSEVTGGLAIGDSVLILPSASLIQSQQEFKQRIGNITGGGLPGVRQTTTPAAGGGR
mgnify:CR=1 FL=1